MYGSVTGDLASYAFVRLFAFGMLPGGEIDVSGTADASAFDAAGQDFLWLMACSDSQTNDLLSSAVDGQHLCQRNISDVCLAAVRFGALGSGNASSIVSSWTGHAAAPGTPSEVSLLALSCVRASSASLAASYHFVNPGGQELSSGDIPLLTLAPGFGAAWTALLAAFLALSVRAVLRGRSAPAAGGDADSPPVLRTLHAALAAPPLLLCIASFVAHEYWRALSVSGREDDSSLLSVLNFMLLNAARASVMMLLLAVARGWQTLRLQLRVFESRHICLLGGLFFCSWSAFQVVGGFFLLFLLVFLYLLALRYCFASLTWNIQLLQVLLLHTGSGGDGEYASMDGNAGDRAQTEALPLLPPPPPTNLPATLYGGLFSSGASPDNSSPEPAPAPVTNSAPQNAPQQGAAEPSRRLGSLLAGSAYSVLSQLLMLQPDRSLGYSELGGGGSGSGGGVNGQLAERQIVLLRKLRAAFVAFLTLSLFLEIYYDLGLDDTPYIGYLVSSLSTLILFSFMLLAELAPTCDESRSVLFDVRGYYYEAPDSHPRVEHAGGADDTRLIVDDKNAAVAIAEPVGSLLRF